MPDQYYLPDRFCIIVASHISTPSRIPYLLECLESLINQTIPVSIYLSISFATKEIETILFTVGHSFTKIIESGRIQVLVRNQKTPQMRHIEMTLTEMKPEHEWILFCDDDDTYAPTRVSNFAEKIAQCLRAKIEPGQKVTGAYETRFGKHHRQNRQEYWCYCVRRFILDRFFQQVRPYPDVIDDKCCDVLFGEFLRRLSDNHLFATLDEHGYNYRVDNNMDSVTGAIRTQQPLYKNMPIPPPMDDASWADYVVQWNEFLYENINVYLHDIYLRTLVGMPLEDSLHAEFKANRPLLEFVDSCHLEKITRWYNLIYKVSNEIYDNKI